jgi:cofilin
MAMSGVTIDPSCVAKYNEVKSCKSKCCIFMLSDDGKTIVPDEESMQKYSRKAKPDQFEQFTKNFPENKCRYGVYNVNLGCQGSDGITSTREKIIFVTWAPDSAKIKDKMMIASSKDSLKKACVGIAHDMQFSDEGDTEASNWIESIGSMTTMKIAGEIVEFEGRPAGDW